MAKSIIHKLIKRTGLHSFLIYGYDERLEHLSQKIAQNTICAKTALITQNYTKLRQNCINSLKLNQVLIHDVKNHIAYRTVLIARCSKHSTYNTGLIAQC